MRKRRPKNSAALRRGADLPRAVNDRELRRRACRHSFSIEAGGVQAVVRYSRSRWRRFEDLDYPIRKRMLLARIEVEDRLAGLLQLIEIDVGSGWRSLLDVRPSCTA